MPKLLCTLPNASEEISGIKFSPVKGGMLSEDVDDVTAKRFSAIPGYDIVEERKLEEPKPAAKKPAPAPTPAPAPAPEPTEEPLVPPALEDAGDEVVFLGADEGADFASLVDLTGEADQPVSGEDVTVIVGEDGGDGEDTSGEDGEDTAAAGEDADPVAAKKAAEAKRKRDARAKKKEGTN